MSKPNFFKQNPIIQQSLRQRRTNWRLLTAIGLAVFAYCPACMIFTPYVITDLLIEPNTFFFDQLDEVGAIIFNATAIFLFILVTLFAPIMSVAAIAGERQRQTLDLLLVTPLSIRTLVIGKLISALLYTMLLLAFVWPIIILTLLSGGVHILELIALMILLTITAVAFTTIGLWVSSLSKTITNATMLTFGVVLPALFLAPILLMLGVTILLNFTNDSYSLEEVITVYGWTAALSFNPIGTAVYSSTLFWYEDAAIIAMVQDLPLVSPWILYTILYTILTFVAFSLTTKRLQKTSD